MAELRTVHEDNQVEIEAGRLNSKDFSIDALKWHTAFEGNGSRERDRLRRSRRMSWEEKLREVLENIA